MGLFDWLKPDPSADWPRSRRIDRTLDLAAVRWAGVAFGDPPESLRSLGRPSNRRPFSEGTFEYFAEGFTVEIDSKGVDAFGLAIGSRPWDEPHTPHPLRVIWPEGEQTHVDQTTVIGCFADRLGDPAFEERDEQEIIQRYDRQTFQLELEAALDQTVRRINLWRTCEPDVS
ncbi:MAG: hypothetical protein R3236_06500 [Phycisphaeraceae bacterium]|nr:hypothetical protein [Phycisphaeraceae bacterium]